MAGKIKYVLYVSVMFIPAFIISFILGGTDAVFGTRLTSRFHHFLSKLSSEFEYD
jgi:hypothetical protein